MYTTRLFNCPYSNLILKKRHVRAIKAENPMEMMLLTRWCAHHFMNWHSSRYVHGSRERLNSANDRLCQRQINCAFIEHQISRITSLWGEVHRINDFQRTRKQTHESYLFFVLFWCREWWKYLKTFSSWTWIQNVFYWWNLCLWVDLGSEAMADNVSKCEQHEAKNDYVRPSSSLSPCSSMHIECLVS